MIRQGDLDLCLTSSFEYLQNRERYDLVPGFCIAAKRVLSVNLYLRNQNPTHIALTEESATSAQLVKLLCRHFWNIDPEFIPLPDMEVCTDYDGFLLIGDKALMHPTFPDYQTIDLADAWYQKTGLPMTFAVLIAQKGVDTREFMIELDQSVKWGEENRKTIVQHAATKLKLPSRTIETYFSNLRYRLGELEMAGLTTFGALSALN